MTEGWIAGVASCEMPDEGPAERAGVMDGANVGLTETVGLGEACCVGFGGGIGADEIVGLPTARVAEASGWAYAVLVKHAAGTNRTNKQHDRNRI